MNMERIERLEDEKEGKEDARRTKEELTGLLWSSVSAERDTTTKSILEYMEALKKEHLAVPRLIGEGLRYASLPAYVEHQVKERQHDLERMAKMNKAIAKNQSEANQKIEEWKDVLASQFDTQIKENARALKSAIEESEQFANQAHRELKVEQAELRRAIQETGETSLARLREERSSVNRQTQEIKEKLQALRETVEQGVQVQDLETLQDRLAEQQSQLRGEAKAMQDKILEIQNSLKEMKQDMEEDTLKMKPMVLPARQATAAAPSRPESQAESRKLFSALG